MLAMSDSLPPRAAAPASSSSSAAAGWRGRLQQALANVPRAALGNLVAKLAIVGLGLAITVLVARMGPKVQGAFALFVACLLYTSPSPRDS